MRFESPHHSTGKIAVWVAFWRIAGLVALTSCFYGCVYSFSNKFVNRPGGIRSIAVEAIYDTSREVVPHEHLWKQLQRAIVADGNLILTDGSTADAILRVHLKNSLLQDAGETIVLENTKKDPKVLEGALPPKPSEFRKLTQAGRVKGSARLSNELEVELWHLHTKQLLFKRSYTMGATFKTFRSAAKTNVTTVENDYLRFEEAIEASFAEQAEIVSRRIVRDILAP